MIAAGGIGWTDAMSQVERMLPVVVFLCAILVVAEVCAAEGLFAALGTAIGRGASPVRMLAVTFVVAAVVTAVLSLDATVVLLTPVVVAAATGTAAARPLAHA